MNWSAGVFGGGAESEKACLIARWHTLSFLLALNFFRHSTVSCLCIMEATVERCWGREREEKRNTSNTSKAEVNLRMCFVYLCVHV